MQFLLNISAINKQKYTEFEPQGICEWAIITEKIILP